MFERFTDGARRVVVLSQEEARTFQHNYIGTEHVLLGLLGEADGTAARALGQFAMTLDGAREELSARVARGKRQTKGHIPFTPRAKKVLELSLREALSLQHDYIGTEHVLLGIIREGDGVAAQIIAKQAGDLSAVRAAVLDMIPAGQGGERRWARPRVMGAATGQSGRQDLRATPAADASLDQATRLAGAHPVGSHHLLLAAMADPNSAATRALISLGLDLERAQQTLREVDVTGTSDELPDEAGRRQMRIHVRDDTLTIETSDPTLIDLARAALEALADGPEPAGTIHGDQPSSASLASVWRAIHDSLGDIRRRATTTGEPGRRGTPNKPSNKPASKPSTEEGADH
jgi:ATP-dependent Clp protease ATP-binding subunit ClpA